MRLLSLAVIAEATGLSLPRLRYTMDHRLLPGAERASRGHRVTRTFTELEAVGIACAAAMLQGGLRRPLVRQCVAALSRPNGGDAVGNVPLERVRRSGSHAVVEIGDGTHWRIKFDSAQTPRWSPLANAAGFVAEPSTVFRLEIGRLRNAIRGRFSE